jgi:amidase
MSATFALDVHQSASQWAEAIRSGRTTSVDALEFFIARVEKFNGSINAVVATHYEAARQRAREADAALARGEIWGPLHGLPMTVKDSFEVVGMPTTSGAPELARHMPATHADAVQRLIDAGAIIFGKTNLPLWAMDLQSYNQVYGTTNNPYDVSRTPGGSSGGAAAALAARLTPLEIGSDIGGSIRTPAHFCGVYGHKTTVGIVPLRGHIPGPPGSVAESDLAVAGPMAAHADDLALALKVIAGPRAYDAVGMKLALPEPRYPRLQDYRVAYWLDEPQVPIDQGMAARLREVIDLLRGAGVQVTEAAPLGKSLEDYNDLYLRMLGSLLGADMPLSEFGRMMIARRLLPLIDRVRKQNAGVVAYVDGVTQRHRDYVPLLEKREKLRFALRAFFEQYDVLLTPVAPVQAFPHQHEGTILTRKLMINGQERPYGELMEWIAFATLIGLPATSAPVGIVNGLPVNIQIIGAAYRDYETIDFARRLAEITGTLPVPPGYA